MTLAIANPRSRGSCTLHWPPVMVAGAYFASKNNENCAWAGSSSSAVPQFLPRFPGPTHSSPVTARRTEIPGQSDLPVISLLYCRFSSLGILVCSIPQNRRSTICVVVWMLHGFRPDARRLKQFPKPCGTAADAVLPCIPRKAIYLLLVPSHLATIYTQKYG